MSRRLALPPLYAIVDPLTAVLRAGARRLLAQAIEAEADTFLAEMAERVGSKNLSFVITSVAIQRQVGGIEIDTVLHKQPHPTAERPRNRFD